MSIKIFSLTLLFFIVGFIAVFASIDEERASWISLHSYAFDTNGPEPLIPEHLKANLNDGYADSYVIVKFPAPITASNYNALQANTEKIYTYLPYFAYLVKLNKNKLSTIKSLTGASWISLYHPAFKISQDISAVSSLDKRDKLIVMIHVFPDANLDQVLEKLRLIGINKIEGQAYNPFFSKIRLLLTPKEVVALREKIAQIREIFWVDIEPRKVLYNDTTIWVGQSGVSGGQTTPVFDHGIYGEGQIVTALDTGIDADMCYFRDTALGLPPRNECNGGTVVNNNMRKVIAVDFLWSSECAGGIGNNEWDTQGHGTHVAGTLTGDNFANPKIHDPGDGMAPGAKLVMQDCGYQTDNCADCPGIGCPVVDLNPIFQQTYTQGTRIHTNSWGDQENAPVQNNYTAASEDADQFMWNNKDFLLFFAAGNSGPATGSVGSPSTAKSVVSVGATQRGSSAENLASFTSYGPTDDSRIKPEVTIPGASIVSAANDGNVTTNNCSTTTMSGTSMASPAAAGLTALIRQYYTEGWYPTGQKNPADAFTPSAALLRATLVNSAQNMTGVSQPIPSDGQGWGRILLDNALYWKGETRRLFATDDVGFPTGSTGSKQWTFTVNSSSVPFKVTLAWTDYPSTPAAFPHINNDIDLRVTTPGGTVYLGNVFSGGQSTTGGSPDRRNTLEQVLFLTPTPGTYTVTVQAYNIPNGPQPFALVVTGDIPIPGVHAQYRTNSAVISGNPTNGDNDAYPDNCETVTVNFTVDNVGDQAANNATATITSSNAFITITTPMPINLGNIAVGGSVNSSFTYTVGTGATKATCQEVGTFNISVTATGQTSADQNSFSFTHEIDIITGNKLYAFEPSTGLEGWTVQQGTWALSANRVNPGGSTRSVHSSQNLDNQCDVILSPELEATSTTQLIIPNWYAIEPQSGGVWYDRANVHIVQGATRTLISPASGKLYQTGTFYDWGTTCNIGTEPGWAGDTTGNFWGNSTFNLGSYAGQKFQIEIRYMTDPATNREGVYVDDIQVTNVKSQGCDAQSDTCVVANPPGKVANTLTITKSGGNPVLSWTAPGTGCTVTEYGVYRGTLPITAYNHASLSCTITTTTYTDSAATGSYYYLVVPHNTTDEGSYGTNSGGSQIPQGSGACKTTQNLNPC